MQKQINGIIKEKLCLGVNRVWHAVIEYDIRILSLCLSILIIHPLYIPLRQAGAFSRQVVFSSFQFFLSKLEH